MRDDKEPKPSRSSAPVSQPQSPADPHEAKAAADPAAEASHPQSGTSSSADVQAYIGRQLRAVYDDVALQPVPDRFLDLMKQLEASTHDR